MTDYCPGVDRTMHAAEDGTKHFRLALAAGGVAVLTPQLLFVADRQMTIDEAWVLYNVPTSVARTMKLVLAADGNYLNGVVDLTDAADMNGLPSTKINFTMQAPAAHPGWKPIIPIGGGVYALMSGAPGALDDAVVGVRTRERIH